jgi:4-amino-4-deoxychorismate lyase
MLVNGESQDTIAIMDRGFQYGDGLFETIEIHSSKPLFLEQHLARLVLGCQKLLIPKPDLVLLRNEIAQLSSNAGSAVLKIIITRGVGGRGYRQPDSIQSTRIVSLHPFPHYPESYYSDGISARFCETRLGLNPLLAGVKHLNRLEQVLARAEWGSDEFQEGLMLDIEQHVIEGTMTNLFYVKNGILYTAPITHCGIAGIIRAWIMTQYLVVEDYFSMETLLQSDEIFVCNSIIGIWRIRELANRHYSIGNMTQTLQHALLCEKQKQVAYENV